MEPWQMLDLFADTQRPADAYEHLLQPRWWRSNIGKPSRGTLTHCEGHLELSLQMASFQQFGAASVRLTAHNATHRPLDAGERGSPHLEQLRLRDLRRVTFPCSSSRCTLLNRFFARSIPIVLIG